MPDVGAVRAGLATRQPSSSSGNIFGIAGGSGGGGGGGGNGGGDRDRGRWRTTNMAPVQVQEPPKRPNWLEWLGANLGSPTGRGIGTMPRPRVGGELQPYSGIAGGLSPQITAALGPQLSTFDLPPGPGRGRAPAFPQRQELTMAPQIADAIREGRPQPDWLSGIMQQPDMEQGIQPEPLWEDMRASASSLAQGFYNWTNPETGETIEVPLPEDVTADLESQGAEPAPIGGEGPGNLLPDTWKQQRARWMQTVNAILGINARTMPDTYFGGLDRVLENYYGNMPYETAGAGDSWYGGYYPYYGGGGGGNDYEPGFWLDRVKWNII